MHLLSIFIFAFTANIDSFLVGICFGVKNTHIPFLHNLLIGIVVCFSTVFSMSLGNSLSEHMLFSNSQILGSSILIFLGVYGLITFVRRKKEFPIKSMEDGSITVNYLAIKETILIGLGLALNNIAMGIGASITGISVFKTSVLTLIFSVLFLHLGNRFGVNYVPNFIIKYVEPLASILIIILGVFEMFI